MAFFLASKTFQKILFSVNGNFFKIEQKNLVECNEFLKKKIFL
jgi:hypothetical protein